MRQHLKPRTTATTHGYSLTACTTRPNFEFADDTQAVFEAAIEAGYITRDPRSADYAGDWMYMYHENGEAAFKHRTTRKYRYFPV